MPHPAAMASTQQHRQHRFKNKELHRSRSTECRPVKDNKVVHSKEQVRREHNRRKRTRHQTDNCAGWKRTKPKLVEAPTRTTFPEFLTPQEEDNSFLDPFIKMSNQELVDIILAKNPLRISTEAVAATENQDYISERNGLLPQVEILWTTSREQPQEQKSEATGLVIQKSGKLPSGATTRPSRVQPPSLSGSHPGILDRVTNDFGNRPIPGRIYMMRRPDMTITTEVRKTKVATAANEPSDPVSNRTSPGARPSTADEHSVRDEGGSREYEEDRGDTDRRPLPSGGRQTATSGVRSEVDPFSRRDLNLGRSVSPDGDPSRRGSATVHIWHYGK